MAEQVQSILERMVAPLKDLRDRGIFTPDEIRSIVNRRRQSEYLLQRRGGGDINVVGGGGVRKADYLRYIEEEILLERLRKLRKEKVMLEMKRRREMEIRRLKRKRRRERQKREKKRMRREGGNEGGDDFDDESDDEEDAYDDENRLPIHAFQSSGPGDHHILQHIHFTYQRLLKKFHYEIELCLNYAEFCKKTKSFKQLGRIYAEALQHHPREEGLWIEAASFEFFGYVAKDYEGADDESEEDNEANSGPGSKVNSKVAGSSIQNARILMQRGLRINGNTSTELWLQYFALELHYVQKLRGRKKILELGSKAYSSDGEEGSGDDEDGLEDDDSKTMLLPCQIIYKNAIKSIPNDVKFRLRFVETCRMFSNTSSLEKYVMESIENDFGKSGDASVEAWVARISYEEDQWISMRKRAERNQKRRKQAEEKNGDISGGEDIEDESEKDDAEGSNLVGFLAAPKERESEDDDNTPEEENRSGKQSTSVLSGPIHDDKDPSLDLIHKALEAVPSPKMYLECTKFLQMRIQRLSDFSNSNNDEASRDSSGGEPPKGRVEGEDQDVVYLLLQGEDLENAVQRHTSLLERLYDAHESGLTSTGLLFDHVDFLLITGDAGKADKLLQDAAKSPGVDARLWLRWADLSYKMESENMFPTTSTADILRMGLQQTPMHNRQAYLMILTGLMNHLMLTFERVQQDSAREQELEIGRELDSLFKKLLLLSGGSEYSINGPKEAKGSQEDSNALGSDHQKVNIAATLLSFLKYTIHKPCSGDGTDDVENFASRVSTVRSVYTEVICRSNYGKSIFGKDDEEIISMKSFFDECIEFEKNSGKLSKKGKSGNKKKKGDKQRLCNLFEAAISFFQSGGGGAFWRNAVNRYKRGLQEVNFSL